VLEVSYNCNHLFSQFFNIELFVMFSFVLIASFLFVYVRNLKKSVIGNFGAALVFLGGLSNLYEWVKTGCVKDYLNFFNLFKFNFADFLVILGVVLVLINIWKKELK
jgi:lipoprotein signal peptidase